MTYGEFILDVGATLFCALVAVLILAVWREVRPFK